MKLKSLCNLIISLSVGFSSISSAAVITINTGVFNGTDVGVVDTFIAGGAKLGKPNNERDWVNDIALAGTTSVDFAPEEQKQEDVSYFSTDNLGVYAFKIAPQSTPIDYYLIKNAQVVALFKNLAGLNWGVFDVSHLSGLGKFNLDKGDVVGEFTISHVTNFIDPNTTTITDQPNDSQVPEPSALLILGMGLIGLFGTSKRKSKTI